MTAESDYITKLSAWSRKDLLRLTRRAGFTAHRFATNEDLARLLWQAVGKLRHGAKENVIRRRRNPEAERRAKRGDLALVHRRLDSIARYWQPFVVTGITRDGVAVRGRSLEKREEKFAHMLLVHGGSNILIVPKDTVDVSAVITTWGEAGFDSLDSVETLRAFVKRFLR